MPAGPPPGTIRPFSNGGMPPMPTPPQPGFPAPMFLPGAPPQSLEPPTNEIMGGSNPLPPALTTVVVRKLPKNWKITVEKDRGVSYYYHTITRHTQWKFPSPADAAAEEAKCTGLKWSNKSSQADDSDDSEEESSEDEDEESSSEEYDEKAAAEEAKCTGLKWSNKSSQADESDDSEEESEDEDEESSSEEYDEKEDEEDDEDYDDHLLAEASRKAQEELSSAPTAIAEKLLVEYPSTEVNSTVIKSEPAMKKKRDGLVTIRIISPRDEGEDYRKGITESKIKETKMKLARQKARAKAKAKATASLSGKSRKKESTCEADTSSGPWKKIKDKFRVQMANVIVALLNPYRKADCKVGRIVNTKDFKHLARKITHFVMEKELRRITSIEDLQCSDNVKHKAVDFIRKYMSKFGAVYSRSPVE